MTRHTYHVGDYVTFTDRYGRVTTGPIEHFEVITDKWSNAAGKRVSRKTPVTFAMVVTAPADAPRGGASYLTDLRKCQPATDTEIAGCPCRAGWADVQARHQAWEEFWTRQQARAATEGDPQ